MQKEIIGRKRFEVNSFLVDPQKKLGLSSLLNLVQDAAWTHATHLGHGYEDSLANKTFWVLTRQRVAMTEWPKWGDEIEIRTWVRPIQGAVATRDSEVYLNNLKIGESATNWILLHAETRRPIRESLPESAVKCREEGNLELNASKIEILKELPTVSTVHIRNSDIDMHDHVNNTRYAQWVIDSIPHDWHKLHQILEYEINFISEIKGGEEIGMQAHFPEPTENPRWLQFQGFREKDQKTVFAARLRIKDH